MNGPAHQPAELLAALVREVHGDYAPSAEALAAAHGALSVIIRESALAWPGVSVDALAFVAKIARVVGRSPASLADALSVIHGPDLYLAYACERGDPRAIALLEKHVLGDIPTAVSKMRLGKSAVDDLAQAVRQKLLVSDGHAPPKIADYAGRGPLDSWVRVVAVREALTLLRKRTHDVLPGDDLLLDDRTALHDPELELIRARYQGEFKIAFSAALQALPARDRTTLRLHFVEGLNIEQIGAVYRVHRATVARWIARSRDDLLADVRRRLSEKLTLSPQEFESLVAVIQSQFEVSLERLLHPDA